ncbi:MAG: tetratricopeptide repeat protein [Rhodospirillaceae bacterium]|nr:tetratricopeptide repeat protein [Rhodospirillaceae bacterium]MBL6931741.1 tetratricopeptide repeat protein [Rhodospirillales bacterium]
MVDQASKIVKSGELSWELNAFEAQKAYLSGNTLEASRLWQKSIELVQILPTEDPRYFTSLNNAGLVYALNENPDKAEDAFKRTLEGWQKARAWTSSMEVSGTARSSIFHHRLEVRHQDHFTEHNRKRYCNWIDGAEAITAFNLSMVQVSNNRKAEGMENLARALNLRQQAFGATNPELAVILRKLAELVDDEAVSVGYLERAQNAERNPTRNALERWGDECPQVMNDMRRLLGAVCLTAMLVHRN